MNWRRGPSRTSLNGCNPTHNRFATAPNLTSWQREAKASPFCRKGGAGNRSRTDDLNLGKVALYQLSYSRILPKPAIMAFRIDGVNCSLLFESHKKKADFFHQCHRGPTPTSPPGATATQALLRDLSGQLVCAPALYLQAPCLSTSRARSQATLHVVRDLPCKSFTFASGISTVLIPPRRAASSFSFKPPISVTSPAM